MPNPPKPAIRRVKVDGYNVVTYSYGSGDEVLFLLNGGPGLPCDYLRDPLIALVERGFRVVTYDQLGCGRSDKPSDASYEYSIRQRVEDLTRVAAQAGLARVLFLPETGTHIVSSSLRLWLRHHAGLSRWESLASVDNRVMRAALFPLGWAAAALRRPFEGTSYLMAD